MDKNINVGLIGFGVGGRAFHGPIIESCPNLNLKRIITSNKALAEGIYPNALVDSDVDDLFMDETIELIIVATPNTSHKELARRALLANKHVVVEKPFTITSKDADELIELANKQKRILTVHQNRRWDSDYLTVKKIIDSGVLGNVVEYEARFDRFRNTIKPNAWREENIPGSGILYDLGSHLIDQAQCLFGLPMEITGDMRIQRAGSKNDDYFEAVLHYEKTKVILKAGMLVREPLPHFIILGDKGSFVKYGMDVQEAALKRDEMPMNIENWGEEPKELWGTLNTEIHGLHFNGKIESIHGDYRAFYENVYRAILKEEPLQVKAEEARNTIRIIELVMESSRKKCSVKFSE